MKITDIFIIAGSIPHAQSFSKKIDGEIHYISRPESFTGMGNGIVLVLNNATVNLNYFKNIEAAKQTGMPIFFEKLFL